MFFRNNTDHKQDEELKKLSRRTEDLLSRLNNLSDNLNSQLVNPSSQATATLTAEAEIPLPATNLPPRPPVEAKEAPQQEPITRTEVRQPYFYSTETASRGTKPFYSIPLSELWKDRDLAQPSNNQPISDAQQITMDFEQTLPATHSHSFAPGQSHWKQPQEPQVDPTSHLPIQDLSFLTNGAREPFFNQPTTQPSTAYHQPSNTEPTQASQEPLPGYYSQAQTRNYAQAPLTSHQVSPPYQATQPIYPQIPLTHRESASLSGQSSQNPLLASLQTPPPQVSQQHSPYQPQEQLPRETQYQNVQIPYPESIQARAAYNTPLHGQDSQGFAASTAGLPQEHYLPAADPFRVAERLKQYATGIEKHQGATDSLRMFAWLILVVSFLAPIPFTANDLILRVAFCSLSLIFGIFLSMLAFRIVEIAELLSLLKDQLARDERFTS